MLGFWVNTSAVLGKPCLQLPTPGTFAKINQSRQGSSPFPGFRQVPGNQGCLKALGHCLLPSLSGGGVGLAPHLVVTAPAVVKDAGSLSSFSTGGELAFLKSTCIFKPFIFHCTESLNIPACVLLVLPSVGAEGIYSVSHSGNGGG